MTPTSTTREHPSLRRERGRVAFAHLLDLWLKRCGCSHQQMGALCDWASSGHRQFDFNKLSKLRNGNQGASLVQLDALGAANEAIWRWQHDPDAAVALLGPFEGYGVEQQTLVDAIWLPLHDTPDEPLRPADLFEILLGLQPPPFALSAVVRPSQATELSRALAELLNELIQGLGLGPMQARAAILRAYPGDNGDAIWELASQGAVMTADELEAELLPCSALVASLRGVPPQVYGPRQLHQELSGRGRKALPPGGS